MTLRFESGFSTVLAVCDGCPARWRQLCGTIEGAELAARMHIEIVHTDPADPTRLRFLTASRVKRHRRR